MENLKFIARKLELKVFLGVATLIVTNGAQ